MKNIKFKKTYIFVVLVILVYVVLKKVSSPYGDQLVGYQPATTGDFPMATDTAISARLDPDQTSHLSSRT